MYIINEENHNAIAVVRDPYKAIKWLVENNWLDYGTCGIRPNGEEFDLWEVTGYSREQCREYPNLIVEYFKEKDLENMLNELQIFGLYFEDIEDIDE